MYLRRERGIMCGARSRQCRRAHRAGAGKFHDNYLTEVFTACSSLFVSLMVLSMGPMARAPGGAQAGQKGVYVRRVEPTSPAGTLLKRGDIVLAFDGTDIANDGTVPFRSGERISFSYLVSKKYVGDKVRACLGVWLRPPCATDRSWRVGGCLWPALSASFTWGTELIARQDTCSMQHDVLPFPWLICSRLRRRIFAALILCI